MCVFKDKFELIQKIGNGGQGCTYIVKPIIQINNLSCNCQYVLKELIEKNNTERTARFKVSLEINNCLYIYQKI